MRPIVGVYNLGRVPYSKALNIQRVLFENLKQIVTSSGDQNVARREDKTQKNAGIHMPHETTDDALVEINNKTSEFHDLPLVRHSLLMLEHEPVYTVGLRAQQYDTDYVTRLKSELAKRNLEADFVYTNRGGLITFHGPGQLVVYPIIYLGDFTNAISNRSIKSYVERLERTIIDALDKVGISGAHTVRQHPGVWLASGERKIAFIGITCKRYVTMHGISINCDCDLSWFDHIVSCGIENKQITSVRHEMKTKQLNILAPNDTGLDSGALDHSESKQNTLIKGFNDSSPRYSVQNIAHAFCLSFSQHFDCELLERQFPKHDPVFCC